MFGSQFQEVEADIQVAIISRKASKEVVSQIPTSTDKDEEKTKSNVEITHVNEETNPTSPSYPNTSISSIIYYISIVSSNIKLIFKLINLVDYISFHGHNFAS